MDAARDLEGQASSPREPWSEAAPNVDAVESATGRSRHAEAPKVHVERPADIRKDDLASLSCSATARVFPPGERVKPVISGLGGHEMPGYQKPRRGSTVLPSSGGGYEAAGRKTNTHS
jgi:hypothetical protein